MAKTKILIGSEFFDELRESGSYYVDKTGFFEVFLPSFPKVSLMTRPRRFGKTLFLTTLKNFFDITQNSKPLFDGLSVAHNTAICETWMNKWPVVFLTLKLLEADDFDSSLSSFAYIASSLCKEYAYLIDSPRVDADTQEMLRRYKRREIERVDLEKFLLILSQALYEHWDKQSIILIDEYDVPIAYAERNGYYDKMVSFIRNMLGNALKTNPYLKFSILTGCLRIAKESIFTGLNNFKCYDIADVEYSETFGFTPPEVDELLAASGFFDKKALMREWYDGYRFGKNTEIYCPWDILQYVDDLQSDSEALPKCYWTNTSGNAIVRSFIDRTDINITDKIETLLAGGCVEVEIVETLTYDTLHTAEDNLWSLLYLTGYLTKATSEQLTSCGRKPEEGKTFLVIPNKEIRKIFTKEIRAWFDERLRKKNLDDFVRALWSGDAETLQKNLTDMLYETISYHDSSENFYHAFLAGIFKGAGLQILSNRESGIGRSDICIIDGPHKRGVIIETKYADDYSKLDSRADEALAQIQEKHYRKGMPPQITAIQSYGISFWKKECLVKIQSLKK